MDWSKVEGVCQRSWDDYRSAILLNTFRHFINRQKIIKYLEDCIEILNDPMSNKFLLQKRWPLLLVRSSADFRQPRITEWWKNSKCCTPKGGGWGREFQFFRQSLGYVTSRLETIEHRWPYIPASCLEIVSHTAIPNCFCSFKIPDQSYNESYANL